jgi:hypothetical protein
MGADYKIKKHYTCMTKLILFKVKINLIAFLSIFQILFWNRLAGSISFARAWPEEIRFRCTSLMDDVGVAHCWRCWEYCLESELKVKGNPYIIMSVTTTSSSPISIPSPTPCVVIGDDGSVVNNDDDDDSDNDDNGRDDRHHRRPSSSKRGEHLPTSIV